MRDHTKEVKLLVMKDLITNLIIFLLIISVENHEVFFWETMKY